MKYENYIDNTDLLCVLRDRPVRGRLGDILYNQIGEKRRNKRCLNRIRAEIRRIANDLRAPIPPPKGEWAPAMGAEVSGVKCYERAEYYREALRLRPRPEGKKPQGDHRPYPCGIPSPGRKVKGRKNKSKG